MSCLYSKLGLVALVKSGLGKETAAECWLLRGKARETVWKGRGAHRHPIPIPFPNGFGGELRAFPHVAKCNVSIYELCAKGNV